MGFRKYLLTSVVSLLLLASTVFGALTQTIDGKPKGYWWRGGSKDIAWRWAKEIEGILDEDALFLNPTDTIPTATEGCLYYNDSVKI